MVTTSTTTALVVIYTPRRLAEAPLTAALELTANRVVEYAGGRETARLVV
jgi:DNA/RNA-binding domain of Phe-tRNA-synthetase-like protein